MDVGDEPLNEGRGRHLKARRRCMESMDIAAHFIFITKVSPLIILGFILIIFGIFSSTEITSRILYIVIGISIVSIFIFVIKKWTELF